MYDGSRRSSRLARNVGHAATAIARSEHRVWDDEPGDDEEALHAQPPVASRTHAASRGRKRRVRVGEVKPRDGERGQSAQPFDDLESRPGRFRRGRVQHSSQETDCSDHRESGRGACGRWWASRTFVVALVRVVAAFVDTACRLRQTDERATVDEHTASTRSAPMNAARALVTGGAGFIGRRLVEDLLVRGWQVWVVDDFSAGRREDLAAIGDGTACHVVEADVASAPGVASAVAAARPSVVFHLAAVHFIPQCERDPIRTLQTNVIGTQAVLNAVQAQPGCRMVFASTGDVYAPSLEPHHERSAVGPAVALRFEQGDRRAPGPARGRSGRRLPDRASVQHLWPRRSRPARLAGHREQPVARAASSRSGGWMPCATTCTSTTSCRRSSRWPITTARIASSISAPARAVPFGISSRASRPPADSRCRSAPIHPRCARSSVRCSSPIRVSREPRWAGRRGRPSRTASRASSRRRSRTARREANPDLPAGRAGRHDRRRADHSGAPAHVSGCGAGVDDRPHGHRHLGRPGAARVRVVRRDDHLRAGRSCENRAPSARCAGASGSSGPTWWCISAASRTRRPGSSAIAPSSRMAGIPRFVGGAPTSVTWYGRRRTERSPLSPRGRSPPRVRGRSGRRAGSPARVRPADWRCRARARGCVARRTRRSSRGGC